MPAYSHFTVRFEAISSHDSVARNTILVFPILAPKDFLCRDELLFLKMSKIAPVTSRLTGVSSSPSRREMSYLTLWGASDRDYKGRCNVTMARATAYSAKGLGTRKNKLYVQRARYPLE